MDAPLQHLHRSLRPDGRGARSAGADVMGGAVAGVLYSLVALGFVLIFKASGVFNFAQGIMVVFAALTLVGLNERGVPASRCARAHDRRHARARLRDRALVLRPLVNQPDIILFMATFGLTYFLIGFGELIFGGEPKVMIADQFCCRRVPTTSRCWAASCAAEDRHRRRGDRLADGGDARPVLPEYADRPRAARRRRQP